MLKPLREYFMCPLSHDIMSDPVIISSGHTFDRVSIQRWIGAGNYTCPITKQPLLNPSLFIPNNIVRSLITKYMPHRRVRFNLESESPCCVENASTLTSSESYVEARVESEGAVPAILQCLDSADPGLQLKALTLLTFLSTTDDEIKIVLVAKGVVGSLVTALQGRYAGQAAKVLANLATVEGNKVIIGGQAGIIRSLVSLLGTTKATDSKEATAALFTICSFPENRSRVVDCGAVPTLLKLASSGLEQAVAVLSLLVRCQEGMEEILKCEEVVRILVTYIKSESTRGIQYGILTLNRICCYNEKFKKEAKEEGVLNICLELIKEANYKTSEIASHLAMLLQDD